MERVIHLKHRLKTAILIKLSPMSRTSYRNQSKHSTACWMNNSHQRLNMTTNVRKVTCKKCLKTIDKQRSK